MHLQKTERAWQRQKQKKKKKKTQTCTLKSSFENVEKYIMRVLSDYTMVVGYFGFKGLFSLV